jgi:multidrug efflux pump subunit AcrA (membrane-fusion protein)
VRGPDAVAKQVTLIGVVEFDERKLAHFAARMKGRLDKLYAITGQQVKRGEPLAEMYTPELLVTTQNLLDANRSGNRNLEGIARDRLRLWGMGDDQVEQALKTGKVVGTVTVRSPTDGHVVKKYQAEGDLVEEGTRLFDVADLSTVWVEAPVLDQSDLAAIKPGLPARVTAEAVPARQFDGAVDRVPVYRDPDTRTLRTRFTVNNSRRELRPGMRATVVMRAATRADAAELAKTKVAAAKAAYGVTSKAFAEGKADAEKVYLWSRRWMETERDVSDKAPGRVAAVGSHLDRMKKLRKAAEARYQIGQAGQVDVLGADFYLAEAELWLARAEAK